MTSLADPPLSREALDQASAALSAQLMRELVGAHARQREAAEALALAERHRAAIEGSTVWRLTAPLRVALDAARRAIGGPRRRPGTNTVASRGELPTEAVADAPNDGPLAAAKSAFRAQCISDLDAALDEERRILLPTTDTPSVSVILILHNQAELTYHCLLALSRQDGPPIEVIILDNASTDRTGRLLDLVDGARVIRSAENLHFLRGVNQAAMSARGAHLLLLNNDTDVMDGAIAAAAARLDADASIGAVGGPILQLDGTLQEAGSIVWRDGHTQPYGRDCDPAAPEFRFRRCVDYCSGAFLMIRRSVWDRLGGFDDIYAPAYYEEVDFCMRLREIGHHVAYEPAAAIVHYEYGSSSSREPAKALYARNRGIFVERHARALAASHILPADGMLVARSHGTPALRVLLLDNAPVAEAALGLVAVLQHGATFVTYATSVERAALTPEVESVHLPDSAALCAFLANRTGFYSIALQLGEPPAEMEVEIELAGIPSVILRRQQNLVLFSDDYRNDFRKL